jgi:DNA repair exonuclease SbcCD ATPase subunit
MNVKLTKLRALLPAGVALAALIMIVGCSESTSRKDVAKAQQNLDDARQNKQEAVHDANQEIANAQQNAREHIVSKPVISDQATDAQQNVADARHDANEKVADAKEREAHAAAELKTTEQQFQETQAKDAFVKQAEQKLADYDRRVDELKQQASTAEGADKDAINRQIDAVQSQRDRADKALIDLKSADLATWKNHQDHVRMAFQELDNSVKNVR